MDNCHHSNGHVNAQDVTDEFANKLLAKLWPVITEFMAKAYWKMFVAAVAITADGDYDRGRS